LNPVAPVPEGDAELLEQELEVAPRVRLQRGEDLIELHGRRCLGGADHVAVAELRSRRRPGLDVEEEVALEEDARADLDRGVLVNRLAHVVDAHRDPDALVARAQRLDLGDLADVDAADADEGALAQVVRGLEVGLDLEVMLERDRLGEAEVRHDDDGHDEDEPRCDPGDPLCLTAPHLIAPSGWSRNRSPSSARARAAARSRSRG